ncbi:MAG: O-antigen ligase family protein [Rhodospirillales bacterium]|nr:O-antigen ligase family protein [Rhodospirillales bacterium]
MAGTFVLARRRINWEQLLVKNALIVIYLLYCLASVAWTNDPAVLMKRWIKDLGNPIMALVILTDRRPYEAFGVVIRRLSFLILPLSILFIKYYPELGRWYRPHDGAQTFTGVATQKNQLGVGCLMIGIYLAWELLQRRREPFPPYLRQQKFVALMLIGMLGWVLHKSNSQTALVCLFLAISIFLLGSPSFMSRNPKVILATLISSAGAIWVVDNLFPLRELVFSILERRPDLTDRTDIWATVLTLEENPLVGVGFMSFWTGARLEEVWQLLGVRLNQAHNGYLEQYLNLGYIGVAFIVAIMLIGLIRAHRHLRIDPSAGMLRLCLIVVAAVYNYTEAAFYGLNNMWILLLLACLEIPRHQRAASRTASRRPEMATGLAYHRSSHRAPALRMQTQSRPNDSPTSERA